MAETRTIYLIHHHLRRGGVTRVMISAAEILRNAGEQVCILCGEASTEKLPDGIEVKVIEGLGYADAQSITHRQTLLDQLSTLYKEGDIWHLHNHSLGKNPLVTEVFLELADRGHLLILQPHDFAEDGRPANLNLLRNKFSGFPDRLYPFGPHIRYAVLQKRDFHVLKKGGIPAEHIHVLSNPISDAKSFEAPSSPPQHLLYLTRAIRRKNVGEFLLWAKMLGGQYEFATSLIPENPQELVEFRKWQLFAEEQNIPVRFGIGVDSMCFRDVVSWSDACVTTSVGEGFGMSFLEPYVMGRPVLGRNLPEITEGFSSDGVDLRSLYSDLSVPVESLDNAFWNRAVQQIQVWRDSMGSPERVQISQLQQVWVKSGHIDFGRLDEIAQREVLRRGVGSLRPDLLRVNTVQPVQENAEKISILYGPEKYLERLNTLYSSLEAPGKISYANGNQIRDAFLNLKTVRLLRT